MIPHERSLVQRMQGRPFVLLGVNSDKDPALIKRESANFEVNWRSFKNQRTLGVPISQTWHVKGWPCLFLIDQKGVIRQKWVGRPDETALDNAINALVKEAEADTVK
jgi:hypothetical protein